MSFLIRLFSSTPIILLVIVIAVLSPLVITFYDMQIAKDLSLWGAFGDYFGGILNPIVALTALWWLIQSVRMQKQELQDTRRALEDSALTQERARFESTFFELLAWQKKVSDITFNTGSGEYEMRSKAKQMVTVELSIASVLEQKLGNEDLSFTGIQTALELGFQDKLAAYESTIKSVFMYIFKRYNTQYAVMHPDLTPAPTERASAEEAFYGDLLVDSLLTVELEYLAVKWHSFSGTEKTLEMKLAERYGLLRNLKIKSRESILHLSEFGSYSADAWRNNSNYHPATPTSLKDLEEKTIGNN